MIDSFKFEDVLIGRTDEGERVYLSADLRWLDRQAETVMHNTVPGYFELIITGLLVEPRRQIRNACAAGQIIDDLARVTRPVKGITEADIRALLSIWKRHSGNGMHALCDHQHEIWTADKDYSGGRRLDLDAIGTCKKGNYRAGSKWLVSILPEYAMDRTFDIFMRASAA